ncbi:TATA element modulatory factor [Manduca sexta]|uniref:TATA element modulatory factor n=1 Tax=Manduca sexta TaxID=7130 RepID=UPI00188FFC93|nr:TATA element modulatory factor [Manduca sexta]
MNWFDTSGLTSLAKTALKEAQKTIDKALDIQDESGDEEEEVVPAQSEPKKAVTTANTPQKDSDFFASWGLTVSAESKDGAVKEQPVVTESPSKSNSQSLWGSFAGSFFEQSRQDDAIVRPPKAKSMNVISDAKYGSQDDLFSKSQLVMSDTDAGEFKVKKDDPKVDERRGSSRSNVLSLMSSRNSSDSVEVLSHSLKTTPDSEASVHSLSSSSTGQKANSESVEILPDSLISPSSIECLGFDSYCSDKNSSVSSNMSPDVSDKKSTPIGDRTEKAETGDSVSLVADDDEDTISYNSISECTAPTVLDTDDKPISPFLKKEHKKITEKEYLNLEQTVLQQKMHISENSSNDGSWSDRTLNADNDSINLENVEEQKKEEHEDVLIEKLSDSSSFYNVNVSADMTRSESFINVEKQQCSASHSSGSSQKDSSIKERTSPNSSDSKSDLIKVGSDRTSGHTSGDELETATSSDIEIIPSPNGDNGFRNSPAKYAFKQGKFDGTTSPNLVDLVLGKSLATKIRGHNRELSEASVQSNTSDESQGSENDRLLRRLCEMAEVLEARENRLLEVNRSNAELVECNVNLKNQVETLMAKHEGGDINTITEDYTQRMSALEKKFQQAIRDKDQLRKQLDNLKSESSVRKNSSELESALKEKDEVIAQLQEEGEKLAKQQLQHSNIIKKLRAKEKDNEQVIKGLRDKIAEQTAELDRLKRSMAAKEELEVNQIEAVYRLTTANKKLETDLAETKSALDDTNQRLESSRTSLEAARKELNELQRNSAELQRRRNVQPRLEEEKRLLDEECARLRSELQQLRADMVNEEKRWLSREEVLRRELRESRELCSSLEAGAAGGAGGGGGGAEEPSAAGVLAQLAQLQRAALHREHAHHAALRTRALHTAELERSLAKAVERERISREECQTLQERLAAAEGLLRDSQFNLGTVTEQCQQYLDKTTALEQQLTSKTSEVESLQAEIVTLQQRLQETEQQLAAEKSSLEIEKKRNAILQEQLSVRGDVSPPHSLASDTLSASLWQSEEGAPSDLTAAGGATALAALAARREGEARALAAQRDLLAAQRDALRDRNAALTHALDEHQVHMRRHTHTHTHTHTRRGARERRARSRPSATSSPRSGTRCGTGTPRSRMRSTSTRYTCADTHTHTHTHTRRGAREARALMLARPPPHRSWTRCQDRNAAHGEARALAAQRDLLAAQRDALRDRNAALTHALDEHQVHMRRHTHTHTHTHTARREGEARALAASATTSPRSGTRCGTGTPRSRMRSTSTSRHSNTRSSRLSRAGPARPHARTVAPTEPGVAAIQRFGGAVSEGHGAGGTDGAATLAGEDARSLAPVHVRRAGVE